MEGTQEAEGWTLVQEQPAETIVLSETQGRTQLNPAVYRAEKQINGSLVTVEADSEELLQVRIASVEANVETFLADPVGREASPPVIFTRMAIEGEQQDPAPEEVEVNTKTVITTDGAFTEEEWAGRSKTDTIVTDEGQTFYSGVGDTEAVDEALAATAEESATAENEATTDPYGDVETQQIVYDTADAIDSPGQSAGGTLVVPAEAEDLDAAVDLMTATAQEAENARVAGTEEDTTADTSETEAPTATAAAQEAADELGVDLADVEGTGTNGKITKADVEQAANG